MGNSLTQLAITKFQNAIWDFYHSHKRDFPWRKKQTPYYVLVSEIMLQQTQADRVVPKFKEFIKKFPSTKALALASNKAVLQMWQGLGYNRRALFLKRAAEVIHSEYKGKVPQTPEELEKLPGIGPYTARAICAFAFDTPHSFIETNIRTVYIHHFFNKSRKKVTDATLLEYIEKTLPKKKTREWYAALMDYGSYLKKAYPNPSRKSAHHTKQSSFKGSERELRGKILRSLLAKSNDAEALRKSIKDTRTQTVLPKMVKEGLITQKGKRYEIT